VGALLADAVVRRIDLADTVAAIEARLPGESVVIVVGSGRGARGVGVVTPEARRAAWGTRLPAGFSRARAGAGIDAARVLGVSSRGVALADGRVVGIEVLRVGVREGPPGDLADEGERADYEARGAELLRVLAAAGRENRRAEVVRAIERGLSRVERRIAATRGDLARLGEAEAIAAQAQWLVAEASRAPRGAKSLKVTDWTTGEPRTIEVPLDPSKPARAQVEAMFQRARRLKRGAKIAEERIAKAEETRAKLVRARELATRAETLEAMEAAFAQARAAAPKDVASVSAGPGRAPEKEARSAPFRTFVTPGGARILVGKGAAQNDKLTFQTARPHDMWLHAKDQTGAHVIVPLPKNASIAPDLLVDAAHLAAHFSDARGETIVDVQYTPRRYLRKPRGSPPGLVVVDREKVIAVRLEPGRVERLLEGEE
jgi:predicted ribosome quality control (RQC) complex YloA/Tae2 family protein